MAVDKKTRRLPLAYFDSNTFGDVLSRVTNDVDTIDTSLQQSISQSIGIAAKLTAGFICHIFAGTGYCHLNQHSCQRRQNHNQNRSDRITAFAILITTAAKEHSRI